MKRSLGVLAAAAIVAGLSVVPASAATAQVSHAAASGHVGPHAKAYGQPVPHTKAAWQKDIARVRQPGPGCYTASYPALTWKAVKCLPAPRAKFIPALSSAPAAPTVSNGNSPNIEGQVTGLISQATGTFTNVNSGISETGPINNMGSAVANAFSLQLNTQFITNDPLCAGAKVPANCTAWQQFVYAYGNSSNKTLNSPQLFIQDWLYNYDNTCPTAPAGGNTWDSTGTGCILTTPATQVSVVTAADLATVALTGSAVWNGNDAVTMSVGSGQAVSAVESDATLDLAAVWTTTQWNVVGDAGGAKATFKPIGASLEPQTAYSGSIISAAPACVGQGTTGESNNLDLATTPPLGSQPDPTIASAETAVTSGNNNAGGCPPAAAAAGDTAVAASSDLAWDNEFQDYGDTSGGWSGGDGAQSVKLPDGDSAWFFGDTYLGNISPDGTHGPLSTGIAHNTSVVYNASSGSLGPVNAQPPGSDGYSFLGDYTWVPPPSGYPSSQYEMLNGDQVIDSNGTLYKFYQLADRDIKPGGFQYKLVGNVLESFSVSGDTLTPTGGTAFGVQDSSGSNPTLWGTAVLTPGDGYTYIYGTEPYNATAPSADAYPLYLARVPVGEVGTISDWQYYDAAPTCAPTTGDWSSSVSAATQLMPGGTSSGFSVTNVAGTYVLLTNNSTGTYNNAVAYYASCPTGFSASSPEYQVYAPSVPNGYLTYEYRIVPQFSSGDYVLVSYSQDTERVDGSCMGENYYNSSIYRPRFLDVTLPNVDTSGGSVTDPSSEAPPTYTAPAVSPDTMYTPTDDYPGTSTPVSQFCTTGATPVNSPSLTVTGNSGDVIDLSWSLQPAAMWMYSVVYCDKTYWAAQGTPCPANLVGPSGNDLTQAIPACSNQVASNPECGFNLDFGTPSSTLTALNNGDSYEIQVETSLAVVAGGYVGSNVVTETASLPMAARHVK